MSTGPIIEKWYKLLGFPAEYDAQFYEALDAIDIPADTTLESYDMKSQDGKRNLLTFLYLCEGLQQKANGLGIPEEVLIETLKDIVIWTENYTEMKGTLFLGELEWLKLHMQFEMFRLGRLQFRMAKAYRDIPEAGIRKGDNVMEIHIPRGSKLDIGECERSIAWAKEFFARYFPEFAYTCFTCNSWLLDDTLKEENRQNKKDAVADFVAMYEKNPAEFWAEFISKPYATTYKLTVDEEAVERYALTPGKYRLIFSTVDECYGKKHKGQTMAQNIKYPGMIARFTDNLYVKTCSDRSSGAEAGATVKAVKGKFADSKINTVEVQLHNGKTEKVNFATTGVDSLKNQMQAIADAIMPKGVSVLVRKADLSVIMDGMRKINVETGKTTTGKEALCEKLIFTAVRKIKEKTAYEVESKAKCHNSKPEKPAEPTEKQEEVESKAADRS